VIAATNQNLEELVKKGLFRRDLFYRVNIFSLALPSLSERREDIPLLVEHFISKFNRKRNKRIVGVAEDTMVILMNHDFPGNVRELENIIEHAFVLCHGWYIEPRHLPVGLFPGAETITRGDRRRRSLKDWEAILIQDAVRRHEGNRAAAARELGINPSTLYRKAKALKIELPESADCRKDD
jgi:transcriptional regulator with PAS, ATPase and Fis domain